MQVPSIHDVSVWVTEMLEILKTTYMYVRGKAVQTSRICLLPEHFEFPPVPQDWVIKDLAMSSCVCRTGHIKDPVSLIEKSKTTFPGGRFPPGFIHQVLIITGLNKLFDCTLSP